MLDAWSLILKKTAVQWAIFLLTLKVNLESNLCCPQFSQKTTVGIILCTGNVNCFRDLLTFSQNSFFNVICFIVLVNFKMLLTCKNALRKLWDILINFWNDPFIIKPKPSISSMLYRCTLVRQCSWKFWPPAHLFTNLCGRVEFSELWFD